MESILNFVSKSIYKIYSGMHIFFCVLIFDRFDKNVQIGNDQEKAQSERNSHSKIEMGKSILEPIISQSLLFFFFSSSFSL